MGTYLTVAEFKSAPTAQAVSNLVYQGQQADQDAELFRVIGRASAIVANILNQDVVAQARTKYQRIRVARDGTIMLHPGEWPMVSVTALSLGYAANVLTAVSTSSLAAGWIDTDLGAFMLPAAWGSTTFGTSVQFGSPAAGAQLLAFYTYIAGYPATTLAATAAAAATSITVSSSAGMLAGQAVQIIDGSKSETVTVTTTPTTNVVAVSALAFGHTFTDVRTNAVAVHAMPDDIRQALILVTVALIQCRGNDATVMGQLLTPGPTPGIDPVTSSNLRLAKQMLKDGGYGRVR